jgi:hypothetical protein
MSLTDRVFLALCDPLGNDIGMRVNAQKGAVTQAVAGGVLRTTTHVSARVWVQQPGTAPRWPGREGRVLGDLEAGYRLPEGEPSRVGKET